MNRHTYPIKMRENEGKLFSCKCVTNGSSDPDGLSTNLTSVTRTAAGKYTALIKKEYRCPQVLWCSLPTLVGAAGYDVYLTSIDKDSYATSTITCDTKANTTDDDYFTLHDGVQQWTVVLDVGGTGDATGLGDIVVDVSGATTAADISTLVQADLAASAILITAVDAAGSVTLTSETAGTQGNRGQQEIQTLSNAWAVTDMTGGIDGVYGFKFETWAQGGEEAAAAGTAAFDTLVNSTDGDYFILNDGHRSYGFELDVGGTGAIHAIAPTASTGLLTCDTLANSTALDSYILNDGQNKAMLWYNVAGTDAAQYSKLGSKAVTTVTFPQKSDVTNEDYFTIWDGHRFWKIMLDTDTSGDSTGTADLIVDISGDTTPADVAAGVHAIIMETTSIPAYTEAIHLTSVDNADGTLTITCDVVGYDGNGTNTENFTHANGLITAAAGGTDAYPAEEFAELDISGATTAADVSLIIHTAIAALTEVRITSVDGGGTVALTNDETGSHGNCSQTFSETGATLMALTDMAGALDRDVQADVWTAVDISGATTAADVGTLALAAINGTAIQITAADAATPSGTLTLTNDNYGTFGNTRSILSETGTTLLAVTDMTAGASGAALADTTDYDTYFLLLLRNSKLMFR